MTGSKPKYYIRTFGCQMNIADSGQYSSILDSFGMESASNPEESDLVLVNTCVVRAKAEEKAISFLGEIERLRKLRPTVKFILAGCLAPRVSRAELKSRFPGLLFAINPSEIEKFRDLVQDHIEEIFRESGFDEDLCKTAPNAPEKASDTGFRFHSFVTIMRGCEQFCTYCVVPSSRGANYSRPVDEILEEIQCRVKEGARAITLLGQSILDYGKEHGSGKNIKSIHGDRQFRELLDIISSRFPDIWIKFLTSHPKDFTSETIDLIASRENISRFIHIPVQSGDNEILRRMGRGHTREDYFKLTEYVIKRIPDARLSSDIIVGFPGETIESFENSLDLLRQVRFFKVFTFQYSPRPGTPAENFPDDVSYEEKRVRLNHLIDIQNQITMERHRELEGVEMSAMVEGASKGNDELLMARSRDEDIIIFDHAENLMPGDMVIIEITEGRQRTLRGKFVRRFTNHLK